MTARPAPESPFSAGPSIRVASPRDASLISALYEASYSSPDGRSPSDNYAFPQILSPEWVEAALETKMVFWLVAEADGRVIGAAGFLRGLGSREDGIAECFGLAVEPGVRCHGLGKRLLADLHDLSLREAQVAIGEMRTADPGAVQIITKCGFTPIGFEPFVHRMLGREESMVMVAILSPSALRQRRRAGTTTAAVRRLAEVVLEPLGVPALDVASGEGTAPDANAWAGLRLKELDPEIGADLMRRIRGSDPEAPRYVELRRMDELGRERARRKQRYFAGIVGDDIVGCIHAAHNRHDYHLRIEAFALETQDVQDRMLRALVELVRRESDGHPWVMATELTVTNAVQQRALESAGFVPTSYCPALTVDRGARLDVVQYTRLLGYTIADAVRFLDTVKGPEAEPLIRTIAAEFERSSSSIAD
jgi:GNAT superfamily N-acetyltransferase